MSIIANEWGFGLDEVRESRRQTPSGREAAKEMLAPEGRAGCRRKKYRNLLLAGSSGCLIFLALKGQG